MPRSAMSHTSASTVGIDPSLTSTGLAYLHEGKPRAHAIGYPKLKGLARIYRVREAVLHHIEKLQPSLVVYEGYALGARGASNTIFDLGELGGQLKLEILARGIDLLVVPPSNLKLFMAGKARRGKEGKNDVKLGVLAEFDVQFSTSDQYDATGLLLMGEAYVRNRPLPRDRRHFKHRALNGCQLISASEFLNSISE